MADLIFGESDRESATLKTMIKSIGHAAFNCYQFEKTLDFYTRILGFEEMFNLYDDAGEIWITYLRVSDEVFIELFPKTGEKPANSGSYSHLCLEVEDIEVTAKTVAERGAILDGGGKINTGKDGNLQVWTTDPEGNRIEFMQLMPDCLQLRAIERIKGTKIGA
jgi:lactoylglutathione lyase